MANITIIVAQTLNRVIGKDNQMPWHLPKDLQHFKETTLHHPVLMGRKTYDSIGKALPNRENVVISNNPHLSLNDAQCFTSLDLAIKSYQNQSQIFVIGGASIYEAVMPIADTLIVTWIETTIQGDAYFPVINPKDWQEIARVKSKKDEKNNFDLHFCTYQRRR